MKNLILILLSLLCFCGVACKKGQEDKGLKVLECPGVFVWGDNLHEVYQKIPTASIQKDVLIHSSEFMDLDSYNTYKFTKDDELYQADFFINARHYDTTYRAADFLSIRQKLIRKYGDSKVLLNKKKDVKYELQAWETAIDNDDLEVTDTWKFKNGVILSTLKKDRIIVIYTDTILESKSKDGGY